MSLGSEQQSQVLQFRPMFLKIRLLFKNFDVTLWVKELKNVAHTIFVVSPIQMDCI